MLVPVTLYYGFAIKLLMCYTTTMNSKVICFCIRCWCVPSPLSTSLLRYSVVFVRKQKESPFLFSDSHEYRLKEKHLGHSINSLKKNKKNPKILHSLPTGSVSLDEEEVDLAWLQSIKSLPTASLSFQQFKEI